MTDKGVSPQFLAEVVERQRGHAQSAAGLAATAAGALAAGLVFSPLTETFDFVAQVLALGAFVLLLASVALFAAAFIYRRRKTDAGAPLEFAKPISDRIWALMMVGSGLALGALVVAVVTVGINLFTPPLVEVRVDVVRPQVGGYPCAALPAHFQALVNRSEVRATTDVVPLRVEATLCGQTTEQMTWIFLPRSSVTLTGESGL